MSKIAPLSDEELKQLTDALKTDDALPAWMDQTSLGHDLARLLATIEAAKLKERERCAELFAGDNTCLRGDDIAQAIRQEPKP